jgi:hypothetical protein
MNTLVSQEVFFCWTTPLFMSAGWIYRVTHFFGSGKNLGHLPFKLTPYFYANTVIINHLIAPVCTKDKAPGHDNRLRYAAGHSNTACRSFYWYLRKLLLQHLER